MKTTVMEAPLSLGGHSHEKMMKYFHISAMFGFLQIFFGSVSALDQGIVSLPRFSGSVKRRKSISTPLSADFEAIVT